MTLPYFSARWGKEELEKMGSEAIEIVRVESGQQGAAWQLYFSKLDRKFNATAYLFRCRPLWATGWVFRLRLKTPMVLGQHRCCFLCSRVTISA